MNKCLKIYLIPILLIVLLSLTIYVALQENNSIKGEDSPNHLLFSIEFFYSFSDIIQENTLSIWEKVKQIVFLFSRPVKHSSLYWPNGVNLTASMFYSLFGNSLFSARLSLFPFLFILLFSTYLIGRLLYSESVGILAAFILFSYPLIFESFRQFQLDSPLTAMVALNILFLIKCDYFRNRFYSFLFGLSLGWAVLIKGQAILFIIWPLLFVLYKTFADSWKEIWNYSSTSRQLENMTIFIAVACLFGSIWWGFQIEKGIHALKSHIFPSQRSLELFCPGRQKYCFASIFFNFQMLFHCLGSLFCMAFFISLPFFLRQKVKQKAILISWLILPLLLFSFVFIVKRPRFLMPVLPAIALLTAWGISKIRYKRLKVSILCIMAAFSLTQLYVLSYSPWHHRIFFTFPLFAFGKTNYGLWLPYRGDFKIDEVIKIIRKHTFSEKPAKIGSISACRESPGTLGMVYWLKMKDRFLEPIDLTEMHIDFLKNFDSLDFILFHQSKVNSLEWPGGERFKAILKNVHKDKLSILDREDPLRWNNVLERLKKAQADFQLIEKIPKDPEFIYYIYKRKKTNSI